MEGTCPIPAVAHNILVPSIPGSIAAVVVAQHHTNTLYWFRLVFLSISQNQKFSVWSNQLFTDDTVHILIIKCFGRDCESSNGGGHTPAGGRMKLATKIHKSFLYLVCSALVYVCMYACRKSRCRNGGDPAENATLLTA